METVSILYPSIAMALLTMFYLLYVGASRFRAVSSGQQDGVYYELYRGGEETPQLRLIGRHLQNHFEVPPLFHIAVLLCLVTGAVSTLTIALAWVYFGLRVVHMAVHLGSNAVQARFMAFLASHLVLMALWIAMLLHNV